MINHIIELKNKSTTKVDVIAYNQSEIPPSIKDTKINIYFLSSWLLELTRRLPSIVYLILRILLEVVQIFYILFIKSRQRYGYILVQNPPSFHIMIVLHIYRVLKNCSIIVDIHNYGYTLFQTRNPLIKKIFKFLEIFWLKLTGSCYFTVSKAMEQEVRQIWNLKNVMVMYDKPNRNIFKPLSIKEKHLFFKKIDEFKLNDDETLFTESTNDSIDEKTNRPLLLLSNSSYSFDDDYDTLLNSLKKYDEKPRSCRLILIMSGQGPYKTYWKSKFEQTKFDQIKVIFKWFKTEDYPLIVGSVDYGICMHNSTSGVDLPIKILDLHSCEVPVLAYRYSSTINELITEGKNGYLFHNTSELTDLLVKLSDNNIKIDWEGDQTDWKTEWSNNFYKAL